MATNTPGVLDDSTADLAWTLMLAAARRLTEAEAYVRAGQWKGWHLKQLLGVDVHHATLGIIGMGRIGQAIARRAAGFDMRVIYHNRNAAGRRTSRSGSTPSGRARTNCSRRPISWCCRCRIRRRRTI